MIIGTAACTMTLGNLALASSINYDQKVRYELKCASMIVKHL
jgi:hypothetical protein